MVQMGVVSQGEKQDGLNPRLSASFNAMAFNIGITISTFLASRQVDSLGLDALPFSAALMVGLALPLCLQWREASVRPAKGEAV